MTQKISLRRPRISPLRYPGGKSTLYPLLRKTIRQMGLTGGTYVEPYAGGAGAGLALLVTEQVNHLVINDLDPAISAFWTTLKTEPNWIAEQIKNAELSVDEWKRQREIYKAADLSDVASLGFATFFLNRTNRSGVLNGGPIGGLKQEGKYKIDARFNRQNLIERIRILSLYSERISVTSRNGVDVISDYCAVDQAFIYADPPYFEKAGSLYLNAFSDSDHRQLAETLNANPNSPWLLTYDCVPQVDTLYPNRRRRPLRLHYSAHRVVEATETAILADCLPEFDDI